MAWICCVLPIHAGTRCGLVDGFVDGSTDADTDGDGVADCLDDLPLVAGTPLTTQGSCTLVVDTFADGDDGECSVDCTLREALETAQGDDCTIQLAPGTYRVDLGSLVIANGTSIVGSGSDDTRIDAEISDPAMIYQYVGGFSASAMLTGLTLEHDGRGIQHECGDCSLILNNCVVRGDPAGSSGRALSIEQNYINLYSSATLNNTIVRDTGGISLDGGGGRLWGNACRITNSFRAIRLSAGFENGASANLTDCEISDNPAGGIYAAGAFSGPSVGTPGYFTLTRCVVRGNGASASKGGGIYLDAGTYISGGSAAIIDSTIEGNHASEAGGGIYIEGGEFPGRLTMRRSTLSGNTAQSGGGLYREYTEPNYSDSLLENCTLSGNVASSSGGAIYFEGGNWPTDFYLRSSTVAYNEAGSGGGIYVGSGETLKLSNSILGANVGLAGLGSGPDCFGTLDSLGHNLIGNLDGCAVLSEPTDLLGVAPGLTSLADNGGPTLTHHPDSFSPAVDNGPDPPSCPETDQRGVPRPQAEYCDIGSVEVAPDSDGDGVPDVIDGCPDDPDKADPGVCGCGVPDAGDTDGDGMLDCVDGCPNDPNKADPGVCGCGVPDAGDTDGDGMLDCVDPCPTDPDFDGDGFGQAGDCPAGTPPDCDDTDPTVFPDAPEVNDGLDNQCPGDSGHGMIDETTGNSGFRNPTNKNEYSWPAQAGALSYEVWRSRLIECIATSDTFIIDPETPDPGAPLFYLNHATSPHVGTWGQDSAGRERDYVSCPE
jgi:CSLREA domain-containing protein